MHKSKKLRTLIKQAQMGKPHAMYRLGIAYELGKHFSLDMTEAAAWIATAAERGYEPAVLWMEDYCFDDDPRKQADS